MLPLSSQKGQKEEKMLKLDLRYAYPVNHDNISRGDYNKITYSIPEQAYGVKMDNNDNKKSSFPFYDDNIPLKYRHRTLLDTSWTEYENQNMRIIHALQELTEWSHKKLLDWFCLRENTTFSIKNNIIKIYLHFLQMLTGNHVNLNILVY